MNQSISEQIKKEAEARYRNVVDPGLAMLCFEQGASFRESLAGKEEGGRWVSGDLSNEQLLKVLKGVSLWDLSDCKFEFGNDDGKHWCNAENDRVVDSIYWDGNLFWMMNNDDSFSPLNPQRSGHEILSESPMKSEGAGWVRVETQVAEFVGAFGDLYSEEDKDLLYEKILQWEKRK